MKMGDLYVAIKGHFLDGHKFCKDAIEKGAVALLVSSDSDFVSDVPTIRVKDTVDAIGSIAAWWRDDFDVPCVGITGSNGKTTTKEMVSLVAGKLGRVLKTRGNYNNLIGLPLTIFNWEKDDSAAVLEMGMNAFGEIKRLTQIARPTIGLITNVTAAHLEKLGDISDVARAKGELFENMDTSAIAIINQEDPFVKSLSDTFKGEKIGFGMQNSADVRFLHMEIIGFEEMTLKISVRGRECSSKLKVVGAHNVMNAMAAVSVGLALGISGEETMRRLSEFKPISMHLEQVQLKNGVRLVNDAYNANPESVKASMRTVSGAPRSGRFIAVLGDMLELGEKSGELHFDIGKSASGFGVQKLYAVGKFARFIEEGARSSGLEDIASFGDVSETFSSIEKELNQGDILLVKGSRGMRMERLVEYLKERVGVD